MVGQTYHGSKEKYRYYGHTTTGAKHGCKVQRIPADEAEKVVLQYLKQSLVDSGYFDRLKKRLKEQSESSVSANTSEIARVKSELKELDQEASNIFKLQSGGSFGDQALKLISERLEDIAKKKSALSNYLSDVQHRAADGVTAAEDADYIKGKLVDFENGFRKSTPTQKKRLIRKTIKQIALTKENLAIWFYRSDEEEIPGRKLKLVRVEGAEGPVTLASEASPNRQVRCLDIRGNGDPIPT